ncbi:methyltransferase-like protein 25B isoform X2 [Anopheles aquasalis]|uniref:methyltransferase-like protein 25B isoform X2 n=1 Tax=Anopheles aquasalis TaxID=42839 RepID=UPI00215B0433|nr:methyltransferase-like protein 25B isoform X2 [Anopheles aquasalis]
MADRRLHSEDHFQRLPTSWRACMEIISVQQLHGLLRFDRRQTETTVWPLAILALRSLFHRLALPREHRECKGSTLDKRWVNSTFHRHAGLFQKSVKHKKRHEIVQFAASCLNEEPPQDHCTLVDIGSGQGNLARALGLGFGYQVCCLEQNESFVQTARRKDAELGQKLTKRDPALRDTLVMPVHLHERVNLEQIDPQGFVQMLNRALNSSSKDEFQFGLIGLHPCGDLAPSLLRLFLACRECRFVKLVCCCYMKLSCLALPDQHAANNYGFPLSEFCRSSGLLLSYQAREIACHAIEQYSCKLQEDYEELKVHAYRAAIECIIVRLKPELKHSGLRGGIKAAEVSFEEYSRRAVEGMDISIPSEELHSYETQRRLERWEDVVKFYTLRLMFAPLVETLILYDRLLFLHERGCNARIDVMFDPVESPRNHAITAFK